MMPRCCKIGVRGVALLLGHAAVSAGSVEERHGSRGLLGLQKNQKGAIEVACDLEEIVSDVNAFAS